MLSRSKTWARTLAPFVHGSVADQPQAGALAGWRSWAEVKRGCSLGPDAQSAERECERAFEANYSPGYRLDHGPAQGFLSPLLCVACKYLCLRQPGRLGGAGRLSLRLARLVRLLVGFSRLEQRVVRRVEMGRAGSRKRESKQKGELERKLCGLSPRGLTAGRPAGLASFSAA